MSPASPSPPSLSSSPTSSPPGPALSFEAWFRQQHPRIPLASAQAVLRLAEGGATVPFIARYRKEQTGNLDEVGIQDAITAKESWDEIVKRQAFVIGEIERQGKLTDELRARLLGTFDLAVIEDLFLPYKQKRKTKAAIAREAGLLPLADWLWACAHGQMATETPEARAARFVDATKSVADVAAALAGASDIVIERLADDAGLRKVVRDRFFEAGFCRTGKSEKAKPASKFETYFDFQVSVKQLLDPANSHRYLAMRRGWMEEELQLTLGGELPREPEPVADVEAALKTPKVPKAVDPLLDELGARFEAAALGDPGFAGAPLMKKAARLALRGHVIPAIESEVHKALRDVADAAAIDVFAANVRKLLLAAPFGPKAVLGVDPGIRTGCKLAVVAAAGQYVGNALMHLESPGQRASAAASLVALVEQGGITAVAVGNGTAGRETEAFVRAALAEAKLDVPVVMVSEAGASVYSASDVARGEFPDLDVTVRGAISIARRLQDPLAELVKVDPKSIGVGQYQHDVSQTALKKSLDAVVESCVNQVGVNLNTASAHLLAHVAGVGPGLARAIVAHRSGKGLFKSRQELLEVPRFSQKVFEQAAGFLRLPGAENPLDNTGVHPERYPALERAATRLGVPVAGLCGGGAQALRKDKVLEDELGPFTFADVVKELERPGRDPRETFAPFSFRADVHALTDLQPGMRCPGIVTNVTNFGAFVDIGVHQDGLVHISQLADRFVKDPREVVSPGDRVQVRVLDVKLDKKQIALTMRSESGERPAAGPRAARPGDRRDLGAERFGDRRPAPGPGGSGGPGGPGRPSGPSAPAQGNPAGAFGGRPFNNPFANVNLGKPRG
jgi:uncharacterized protein